MKDNQKYYGEVWLENKEKQKHFCVLEYKNKEVHLETNLSGNKISYKQNLIYGLFNGLGYLTFINNIVKYNSTGVASVKIYNPEYTFVGEHFVSPDKLKINQFSVDNDGLLDWIRHTHWFDFEKDQLIKEKDLNHKIELANLDLEIIRTVSSSSNKDYFKLTNIGFIEFTSKTDLTLDECIELYKRFQKLLIFIFGKSYHFEIFKFKCKNCSKWLKIYYNESLVSDNDNFNFISLVYSNIKEDLDEFVKIWFSNIDIQFCSDIIIENLLAKKVSHSRRFTNSLSAFEAYSKRFGKKHKNPSLKKFFLDESDLILNIIELSTDEMDIFISKIIRSRDYYVHGNRGQKDIFSQFELLYISFLIDYIVGIRLLKLLKCSDKNINKIIGMANSTFKYSQPINKMLSNNPFNSTNN